MFHTNNASSYVVFPPGQHHVIVEYRTPATVKDVAYGDWNTAVLKVMY